MTSALERALLGVAPAKPIRLQRVKITTVGPLTVTLPSGVSVPALAVAGLTYTANANGVAFVSEGAIPLVFPTT